MPVVIKDIITNARNWLQYPEFNDTAGGVSLHTMLIRLQNLTEHYRNRMNITDADWILQSWPLVVTPNQDTFLVSATNFGRPVLIESFDTTGDPNFIRRTFPLIDIPDIHLFYLGPTTAVGTSAAPHVATSFSLFEQNLTNYFRVTPQHTVTATYTVWFEPQRVEPPGMLDNWPLLENFVGLMAVHLAKVCFGNVAKLMDDVTREETKDAITSAFEDMRGTFETYVRTNRQDNLGPRRGWQSELDSWDYQV